MGRSKRMIPVKLGQKLKAIREHLGLTGEQLIARLDCPSVPLDTGVITKFEKGLRDPSSIIILRYARLAKVPVEAIIDDEMDLPFK